MPDVLICEVGPRDGLQNAKHLMPTAAKKAWIGALAAAGIEEIEVGSFVPPKLIPAMADTGEVVSFSLGIKNLKVVALEDRKSTRLNSSHPSISYAVFCLKKKKHNISMSI